MTLSVAVIGANGKVGLLSVQRLAKLKDKFNTTAFIRSASQAAKFTDIGVSYSTEIDLTNSSSAAVAKALKGYDAVVFAAGAGGKGLDLTFSVDLDGAVKVAEAVKSNKISRFVIVSAIKAQDRDFWWDTPLRSYYIAKKYADEVIKGLGINYTILEPGWLRDIEGTGKIEDPSKVEEIADTHKGTHEKYAIPRDDVAIAIVQALENENTNKKVIPLISGSHDISEVFSSL